MKKTIPGLHLIIDLIKSSRKEQIVLVALADSGLQNLWMTQDILHAKLWQH